MEHSNLILFILLSESPQLSIFQIIYQIGQEIIHDLILFKKVLCYLL